jgi:TetR/AcrR family transcriptional repressor of nem operon
MRYPAGHKRETNERILRAAGRLFRRQGYAATGVDTVMASAGLTAGAFYSHFHSKEDLLAETLDTVFREARNDRPKRLSQLRGREWIRAFAAFYLSKKHRDTPDRGCPVAALAGEVGRIGGKSRAVMGRNLRRMFDTVGQQFDAASPDRRRAITTVSLCLGGLMLARAVNGSRLSEEILRTCRETVMEDSQRP